MSLNKLFLSGVIKTTLLFLVFLPSVAFAGGQDFGPRPDLIKGVGILFFVGIVIFIISAVKILFSLWYLSILKKGSAFTRFVQAYLLSWVIFFAYHFIYGYFTSDYRLGGVLITPWAAASLFAVILFFEFIFVYFTTHKSLQIKHCLSLIVLSNFFGWAVLILWLWFS